MDTPDDVVQQQRSPAGRKGFNGELPEPMTGHYLLGNGYRAYSPLLMIFLQPDSWSPFGAGGLNAYAYCEGDAVNAVDPTGHVPMIRPIRLSNRPKSPTFSPYDYPPSSPFTASKQASRYLADFVKEPTPPPPSVEAMSPRALAPALASPLRSRSPSPQPSRQASPSSPASASSAADTEPLLPPISDYAVRANRIATELPPMIDSNNAQAILALARENFSRLPVVRQLLKRLPFAPNERTSDTRRIQAWQLTSLALRARRDGMLAKAEFYDALRPLAGNGPVARPRVPRARR